MSIKYAIAGLAVGAVGVVGVLDITDNIRGGTVSSEMLAGCVIKSPNGIEYPISIERRQTLFAQKFNVHVGNVATNELFSTTFASAAIWRSQPKSVDQVVDKVNEACAAARNAARNKGFTL